MGLLLTQLSWVQGPGYPGADDYPANWTYPGQGPLQSAARSAATLTISTTPNFVLQSDGVSTATLALTAPTQIPLGASAGVSSATLALTAPFVPPPRRIQVTTQARERALRTTHVTRTRIFRPAAPSVAPVLTLSAAAVSTATLALTAPTQIPLGTSTATSAATLALTAPTQIVLQASAATSTATLALTIPTISLGPASHGEGSEFALIRSRAREFAITGTTASDTFPG